MTTGKVVGGTTKRRGIYALRRVLAVIILLPLVFLASCDPTDIRNITSEELKKMIDGGEKFVLVDTRSDFEYRRGTIQGAINIPQEKFETIERYLPQDKDLPIIFFCRGYG
jgi:hypothetical protein